MKNLLRHMLLVCLLAPSLALYAQPRNPYDLELETLRSQWPSASKLEKLALLDRVYRLRDYVDDRSQVNLALENVRQSTTENDLVKNEAAAYLDDLRAFQVPSQPRAQHWYVADETSRRVLLEAQEHAEQNSDFATLAELEHLSGKPEAADHILQAAHLEPTAAHWLRAAEFCDDPLRKFAALRSGLALAPANPGLNVELATYYVGRQQLEKARDVLAAAMVSAPENFIVRERQASILLNLGIRSAALPELRRLENNGPLRFGSRRGWLWITSRWVYWMMLPAWRQPWSRKRMMIASKLNCLPASMNAVT